MIIGAGVGLFVLIVVIVIIVVVCKKNKNKKNTVKPTPLGNFQKALATIPEDSSEQIGSVRNSVRVASEPQERSEPELK